MSEVQLRERARALFNSPFVPMHVNERNQARWISMILRLGNRWVLAKPLRRCNNVVST